MPKRLALVALSACLLAIVSCKTGPDSPPAPVISATPSVAATATRPPASPTPRPTATVTAIPARPTPIRGPLSYNFGAAVDSGDRAIIIRSIDAARDLLQAQGAGSPPCVILAYSSIAELTLAYGRLGPNQRLRAADVGQRLAGGVAEAGFRSVAIYTGGEFWRQADAVERSRVIAHEYVHVVQLEMEGESRANQIFSTRPDSVSPGGPFWLLEGSAELLSWQVMETLRLGNLRTALDGYAHTAGSDAPALASLETYAGYAAGGEKGVAKSVLGVEFLLRGSSSLALFNFWLETRVGRDWQDTFRVVFGATVPDFYRAFEAAR